MTSLSLLCFAIATLFTAYTSGNLIHGRDINRPLLESYDYIVVGCGISGLVVTNRLSEDPDRTVLCIEAGPPDHYERSIQYPVYVGSDVGGDYDWHMVTTPQTQLDGAIRPLPQGKVLGGGSILNAMVWNRGGADDYDAWEELGNPGWGWKGMLPYFKKSETYTPVASAEDARRYSITFKPDVHGSEGPIQVSYPRYIYPQSANLFEAHHSLGIPNQFDVNDGTSAGPAFTPQDIDPNNMTRCDARRAYFDPHVTRDNFHIITSQHVTRILIEHVANNTVVSNPTLGGDEDGNGSSGDTNNEGFGFGPGGSTPPVAGQGAPKIRRQEPGSSNLRIQGVEFAQNASSPRQTVYATREVIVAAGSLHSAQLLQLSGIGPSSLLNKFDIPIAIDLPGVGNNLQDHCLVGTFYPYNNASYPSPTELTTNATFNAEATALYERTKTGPYTAGAPDALAFNPLSLISNSSAEIIASAGRQDPTDYLPANTDSTIVNGYAAQKRSLVSRFGLDHVAAYEIINNNVGSLTVSVMHPFSRGSCYITSADPFQPPAIDPRWLSNPVDRQVLLEALRFNRLLLAQPSMQELRPAQFVPRPEADEAGLNSVINGGIRTEFHPSVLRYLGLSVLQFKRTLAMLPLQQGGVVNSHLLVYGTQNLRVVDASMQPLVPAAHLQAVVYGVAEKAADIIKADNLAPSAVPSSSALATSFYESPTSVLSNSVVPSSTSLTTTEQTVISSTESSLRSSTGSAVEIAVTDVVSGLQSTSIGSFIHTSGNVSPSTALNSGVTPNKYPPTSSTTFEVEMPNDAATLSRPAQSPSVMTFTTTLPSDLPGQLSTISIDSTTLGPTTLPTPAASATSTATGEAQVHQSVAGVLTSVGIAPSDASSLAPVIVGSPPEAGATTPASNDQILEEMKRRAAIDAILQWIKRYFHNRDQK